MSYRLLQAVVLIALVCTACGSRQVEEPGRVDSGVEASAGDSGGEAGDAAGGADAGLRLYACKVPADCQRYFGFADCVNGICCLGFNDGHGHCVCGSVDGGCQDPHENCCETLAQPAQCQIDECPT